MALVVHQTLHLYAFVDAHKDETLCVSELKENFIFTYPDLPSHQQLAIFFGLSSFSFSTQHRDARLQMQAGNLNELSSSSFSTQHHGFVPGSCFFTKRDRPSAARGHNSTTKTTSLSSRGDGISSMRIVAPWRRGKTKEKTGRERTLKEAAKIRARFRLKDRREP